MLNSLVLCLSLVATGTLASLDFIKPCRQTDSECILNSAKLVLPHIIHGNAELGSVSLDPLAANDVSIDAAGLKLTLKDIVVHGLSKCTMLKIVRDPVQFTGSMDLECPIRAVGTYDATGKLMTIDVFGSGPFEVKGDKLKISVTIQLPKFTKNGKEYYKISSFQYKYEPVSKFSLKFENLFNGDRARAEPVEQILQVSSNELLMDENIGKPIIKEVATQIIKIMDTLFQSVPTNEVEIEG